MESATNEDKKRGSVISQISRKRSRHARVSLSGVKQEVSTRSASCDGVEAAVAAEEAIVPSKKCRLSGPAIPTSQPFSRSYLERNDLKDWTCQKCTLVNTINRKRCLACGSREPIKASVPSLESLQSSLTRSKYSTPGKSKRHRADTSIVIKLVEKLDTPRTRKSEEAPICVVNSLSHQKSKSSAHLRTELDGGRNHFQYSTADTCENECSERNDTKGANISMSERSLLLNSTENKPSDRKSSKNSLCLDEYPADFENAPPYQLLQIMLVSVLDKLDSMDKRIHTQNDELQSFRDQNEGIALSQKQILDEIREMRASLLTLQTRNNGGRFQSQPNEASVNIDTPTSIRSETKHASSIHVLLSGVCFSVALIALSIYCKCE